jgi:hypothetical protein
MKEIPWAEEGCTSAKLEYLAWRQGFFFDGHRALTDCLAGLHLLSMALPVSGEPTLKVLLDRARQREYRIWAEGSPFDAKEILKARGYHWSAGHSSSAPGLVHRPALREAQRGNPLPAAADLRHRGRVADRCPDGVQPVLEPRAGVRGER